MEKINSTEIKKMRAALEKAIQISEKEGRSVAFTWIAEDAELTEMEALTVSQTLEEYENKKEEEKKEMEKDFRELLYKFNSAVKALNDGFKPEEWTNRASIYMHKLDHAEDLRIALLECGTPSGVEGELFKDLCRKLEAAEDKLQDILQNKEGKSMNIIEKMRSDRFWCEMEDIEELYSIYLTDSEQFNTLMNAVTEWEGETMRSHLEGSWNPDQEVVEWYKHYKFMQALYSYIYPWENSENGIDLAKNYSYYRG